MSVSVRTAIAVHDQAGVEHDCEPMLSDIRLDYEVVGFLHEEGKHLDVAWLDVHDRVLLAANAECLVHDALCDARGWGSDDTMQPAHAHAMPSAQGVARSQRTMEVALWLIVVSAAIELNDDHFPRTCVLVSLLEVLGNVDQDFVRHHRHTKTVVDCVDHAPLKELPLVVQLPVLQHLLQLRGLAQVGIRVGCEGQRGPRGARAAQADEHSHHLFGRLRRGWSA